MPDYQSRVVEELDQLNKKLKKLEAYLLTESFKKLDDENRFLLTQQNLIMNQYAMLLERRIVLFQ